MARNPIGAVRPWAALGRGWPPWPAAFESARKTAMRQLSIGALLVALLAGTPAAAARLCLPGETVRRDCPGSPLYLAPGNQDLRPEASPLLRGDAPFRPQPNYFAPPRRPPPAVPHRYSIAGTRCGRDP